MIAKRVFIGLISLFVLLAAAGCGSFQSGEKNSDRNPNQSQTQNKEQADTNNPVSLLVYLGADFTDEDFKLLVADPVHNKFPNITINSVKPETGTTINDLIAAGTIPDLIATPNADLLGYKKQDLLYDIAPLLKEHKVDLSRFQQATIDAVKGDKGEIWALPYSMQFDALYYNKDIFDKFGVTYPKDGMNWEDAIELGKKVTRTDGNVSTVVWM